MILCVAFFIAMEYSNINMPLYVPLLMLTFRFFTVLANLDNVSINILCLSSDAHLNVRCRFSFLFFFF